MKRLAFVSLLLFAVQVGKAQPSNTVQQNFKYSRVVLVSGDTLSGPISVRFLPDILSLGQPDGSVRTLVPTQVAAFVVQGHVSAPQRNRLAAIAHDSSIIRLFRTVAWQPEGVEQRPEPLFFEQMSEGPVLLLRRQSYASIVVGTRNPGIGPLLGIQGKAPQNPMPPPAAPTSYLTKREVRETFYLAWPTGEIRPIKHGKKDLLAAFPQQAKQLQAFAKAQGLGYSTVAELHELVNYANSLASTSSR